MRRELMNERHVTGITTAEDFWRGRCLDCAHPEHEMTCHEMLSNGDPSNGPAYCPCAKNIELMEQEIVRLRGEVASRRYCRDTTVIRAAQRIGEERPVERIYICDRNEGHTGQHVGGLPYDDSVAMWSDVVRA